MLKFASSFFMQNKCYICGKRITEKYICDKCFYKFSLYKNLKFYKEDYNKNNKDICIEYLFVFDYKDYIRKLILAYKFFNKPYLGKVFSEFIIRDKKICQKLKSYDIIIPVPMSKKSKKIRGYNQTEIIAEMISKNIGIKYIKNVLLKQKETKKQSSLNRKDRLNNVKNAYKINEKFCEYLSYKKIILFDDIYTTGATINECLKVIINTTENLKSILVIILAKD